MPKRKERMAGYIRESDPSLADSTTIESAARAVRMYGEKEGYIYEPQHEYKEAISAYNVPYMERKELLRLLKAAERKEFDVVVVTEIRAISRRQVEVFIVYDILQKHGIRLETIKEKFEDSAMGRLILSLRAAYAEIEREQSFMRMQRGKKDRIEIGQAPNGHGKPAYGYVLVDTEREVKGAYQFDKVINYVDKNGKEWSEYTACLFIFDLLKQRVSLHCVVRQLNDLGIPPPGKPRKGTPRWSTTGVKRIVENPIYSGQVWANRYKRVGKRVVPRPRTEWVRLPDAPALIDRETQEEILKQLKINREESIRNNHHRDELGLLRAGHIYCGVCGHRMQVVYATEKDIVRRSSHRYRCQKQDGKSRGAMFQHLTQIRMPMIDRIAWEKVVATLQNYELVRARVAELREQNAPAIDSSSIEETLENIKRAMQNLYRLAEQATDDETIAHLTERMNNLEKQKRDAEALLYDAADDEEERLEIEREITKFEKWAESVRPFLTDPKYTPSYEEMRLAVRILGVRVTVHPTQGEWPYRYKIDITVPAIMEKVNSVTNQPTSFSDPSYEKLVR